MVKSIQQEAEKRMQKSLELLQMNLAKLRTGRAHPSLLEHITVEYYGSEVPLNQVASVAASDARTLTLTCWDKNAVKAVEKAIMNSDLGLNPMTAGEVIRVPMPALNEERRRDLTKVVRQEGEHGKVAVRNIRRDANNHLKDLLKEKQITEDEERRSVDAIQKLTDKFIEQIDKQLAAKEADLMEV